MNERIREFLLAENKSSAQLAEEIGVQPSGISHILSGRNHPSLDFVLKMLETYKFLSNDWLLFGTGSMYKEERKPDLFNDNVTDSAETDKNEESGSSIHNKNDLQRPAKEINRTISLNTPTDHSAKVEKIVWFFNDNTFEEYFPS